MSKLLQFNSLNSLAIADVMTQLMNEVGIKEAELARQTGLPQTTVNRLLLGGTSDPRANTLKPLAKFFGVTVGQLLGLEPLDANRIKGLYNSSNRASWTNLPIISWESAIAWIFNNETYTLHSDVRWVISERSLSDKSFALESKPFMEPRYRRSSILLVEPVTQPIDNQYVVITLDNKNSTVRQIMMENETVYLKHFDRSISTEKYDPQSHRLLGTIIEARTDD